MNLNTNHLSGVATREVTDPAASVYVAENAPGGTLLLAYGLTPSFNVRLAISGADHETTDPEINLHYGSLTMEAAYVFRNGREVRPYLYTGVGTFSLESSEDEYDYEASAPGFALGGGLYSFLGEHFVFDAGLRLDLISWEEETTRRTLIDGSTIIVQSPVQEDGTASKIVLGAGWWF